MIITNVQYELLEDLYTFKHENGKPVLVAPKGSIVTILDDLHFPALIAQGEKGDKFSVRYDKIKIK